MLDFIKSRTYSGCLPSYFQDLGSLRSVLRHLNRVALHTKDWAVVINIQDFDFHCDDCAESRAAAVRGHHLQGIFILLFPVQAA